MSSRRLERVNELLKHEIGEIIRRQFNIADTGLVSVNAVETSGDLRSAKVFISIFGKPDQQWLDRISVEQAERYAAEGHFGAGSMQPKIEALLTFVKGREGGRGVISNPESIARALRGETGTWIER